MDSFIRFKIVCILFYVSFYYSISKFRLINTKNTNYLKLNESKHAKNNIIAMIVAIIFVLIPQILLVILFSKAQYNMGQEEIILNNDLNQGLISKDTYIEYISALAEVENYNIANLSLGCVNIVIGILCIILSIYIINKKS